MQDYILCDWQLINLPEFFMPPFPFQPLSKSSDPCFPKALFPLTMTTANSIEVAPDALHVQITRHAAEETGPEVDQVRAWDF
jgi:hypothetical protein